MLTTPKEVSPADALSTTEVIPEVGQLDFDVDHSGTEGYADSAYPKGPRSASTPSPLLDLPRITCSTGCGTELMPRPDRRHVDNLVAAGWTCGQCRRSPSPQEPPC